MVELLVSLSLTGIVAIIVFYVYLSSSRAYLRFEQESSFAGIAGLVLASLDNAFTEGTRILEADNSSLTILENNLKTSRYELDNSGRLYKNNLAIIPEGFRIANLMFKYILKSETDSLLVVEADQLDADGDFIITEDELTDIKGVQYSFTLESQKEQGDFAGTVMLRYF